MAWIPNELLEKLKYTSVAYLPPANEMDTVEYLLKRKQDRTRLMCAVFEELYDAGVKRGLELAKNRLNIIIEGM